MLSFKFGLCIKLHAHETIARVRHIFDTVVGTNLVQSDALSFGYHDVARAKTAIVVVPGNPGCVHFYSEMMECLYERFRVPVLGSSHAGHSILQLDRGKLFSLDDQIEHLKSFLKTRVFALNPNISVILAGHSIGAYISQRICIQSMQGAFADFQHSKSKSKSGNRGNPIARVVCMFPTFRHLEDGLATPVRIAVRTPFLRQIIGYVFEYLVPRNVKLKLMEKWETMDAHNTAVAASMLHYNTIQNILYMALTECHQVRDVPREMLETLIANDKLRFLYSPTDNYTPKAFVEELLREFEIDPSFVTVKQGATHAFVGDDIRDEIFAIVGDYMQDAVFQSH